MTWWERLTRAAGPETAGLSPRVRGRSRAFLRKLPGLLECSACIYIYIYINTCLAGWLASNGTGTETGTGTVRRQWRIAGKQGGGDVLLHPTITTTTTTTSTTTRHGNIQIKDTAGVFQGARRVMASAAARVPPTADAALMHILTATARQNAGEAHSRSR